MKDDQAVEELPDDFKVKNSGGRENPKKSRQRDKGTSDTRLGELHTYVEQERRVCHNPKGCWL